MITGLFGWLAGSRWALAAAKWGAVGLTVLLFLLSVRRAGERAGRMAERLENVENANDVQRRMLEAAARQPRSRDELARWLRHGRLAAERGILMRSGEAFQILKDITHVVFDKTGTLTEGKPRLVAVEPVGDLGRDDVLRLAAGAESPSEHPLARAILDGAEEQGLDVPDARDFQATAGQGVEATVEGHHVLVGTPRFLRARNIEVAPAEGVLDRHEAQAHTAVLVGVDGVVAGLLAIADAVKPDARDAIAELSARGITSVMLTGDNERTARAVAEQVGIAEVHAQVVPQDKAEKIRELQNTGGRVGMVGDGINDAPALMQAHVGIAIGAGTDIAIESSDVVLIGERLGAVPEAITIGAKSYAKTVQNLWLAFFFNGVGVPTAATGLVHPSGAMAAMAASVSLVLANSFGGRVLKKPARLAAARARPAAQAPSAEDEAGLSLSVPDMHCQGCLEALRAGLMLEDGVAAVDGDPKEGVLDVRYRPGRIAPEAIETAVCRLGYRTKGLHLA